MRKLVESTFVTLDGVIGNPEVWGPPYWDDDHNDYATRLLSAADALLLGRATYEGFAKAWPSRSDAYADRINSLPAYVASRTLTAADKWNGRLIEGDVAEPKQQSGQNIMSSEQVSWTAPCWSTSSSTSTTT